MRAASFGAGARRARTQAAGHRFEDGPKALRQRYGTRSAWVPGASAHPAGGAFAAASWGQYRCHTGGEAIARPGFLAFSATAGTGPPHRTPEGILRASRSRSDEWMEITMSENTKPAGDETNETPEVEAH
ncbi:hypothetical protein DBP21_11595, partial [Streptomyces sp. CS147]